MASQAAVLGGRSFAGVALQRPSFSQRRRVVGRSGAVCVSAAAERVVIGDIGGTNARFQVWEVEDKSNPSSAKMTFEKTYPTKNHATFEEAMSTLLKESGSKPQAACIAVAGPVTNDVCNMTNLSWTVDGKQLASTFGMRGVRVINDFEAVGYGVLDLPESQLVTLNNVPATPKAPIAVLGPGTGLGEALLTYDSGTDGYKVWPSEGSHGDFAPVGTTQRMLTAFVGARSRDSVPVLSVEKELGECEIEQVCCGSGLARIYRFLRAYQGQYGLPAELSPAAVSEKGLSKQCPVCSDAIDVFLEILGAEAANQGLKILATGGIYIAGGIPAKLLPRIQEGGLLKSFLRPQARFAKVRATMPLHVVIAPDVGLVGSRAVALKLLQQGL